MRYVNAKEVLPAEILELVQQFTCGALIYIPKKDEEKIAWGQRSGAKALVRTRNNNIMEAYRNGISVYDLTQQYCLSEASIKKIIYSKKAYADIA